jgi:hypothetical protein
MLPPGVSALAVVSPEHEATEGLTDGLDVDFNEALTAYVEVCKETQCDKTFTQAWQRHSRAPFSEALMDLVAVYRMSQPSKQSSLTQMKADEADHPAGSSVAPVDVGSTLVVPSAVMHHQRGNGVDRNEGRKVEKVDNRTGVEADSGDTFGSYGENHVRTANSFGRRKYSKLSKISRSLSWNTRRR